MSVEGLLPFIAFLASQTTTAIWCWLGRSHRLASRRRPMFLDRRRQPEVAKVEILSHSLESSVRPTDVGKTSVDQTDAANAVGQCPSGAFVRRRQLGDPGPVEDEATKCRTTHCP